MYHHVSRRKHYEQFVKSFPDVWMAHGDEGQTILGNEDKRFLYTCDLRQPHSLKMYDVRLGHLGC